MNNKSEAMISGAAVVAVIGNGLQIEVAEGVVWFTAPDWGDKVGVSPEHLADFLEQLPRALVAVEKAVDRIVPPTEAQIAWLAGQRGISLRSEGLAQQLWRLLTGKLTYQDVLDWHRSCVNGTPVPRKDEPEPVDGPMSEVSNEVFKLFEAIGGTRTDRMVEYLQLSGREAIAQELLRLKCCETIIQAALAFVEDNDGPLDVPTLTEILKRAPKE
jgi:hypothetical protein